MVANKQNGNRTLIVENFYTQLPDDRVKCVKTMVIEGWILRILFKLHFEAATRNDMHATWLALEKRCAASQR